jgi:colanic acid/amylovoran biosynthesis glycosyltransferase
VRVAYVVSRFPHVSETFIVRELDSVSEAGIDIELFSLFSPVSDTVHPVARPWTQRLHRGGARRALAALGWWLAHRPLRLASTVALVCAGHRRRPGVAVRALATVAIACDHARTLRADPVDRVHAHYATYPALAAWTFHRLLGLSYSFTAHAHDLYVDQSMLARKLADADFVVTISEFNRRFLAAHGGAARADCVHVVHCGVDPRAYRFRRRAVPTEGPVRALCVASLQEYKGHAVLLHALAARAALGRLEVELVGAGELRDPLERLAAELGLSERVRFAGSLTEQEVLERLDAADLFVLPSIVAANGQMEGLPVALMEALACGVPVVTTRLSGIPELVEDGVTGLLAEPGDADDLAAALERALAEPLAAGERGVRGRAKVEREFDIHVSGARMAALLREAGEAAPLTER